MRPVSATYSHVVGVFGGDCGGGQIRAVGCQCRITEGTKSGNNLKQAVNS